MSLKPRKRFSITLHPLTPDHELVHRYVTYNTCSVSTVGLRRTVWAVWLCANSISMFPVTDLPYMGPYKPIRI